MLFQVKILMRNHIIEGFHKPFVTDIKKSIKSRIVILLDHSSSVSDQQIEYKKATIGFVKYSHS